MSTDRPLCSGIRAPETVMSTGGQITDCVRSYAPYFYCGTRTCYDLAGKAGRLRVAWCLQA